MPLVAKTQWWRRMYRAWREKALQAHAEMKKQLASMAKELQKASRAQTKKQLQTRLNHKKKEIAELEAVDAKLVAFLRTQGIPAKELE
jgi:hypothetical protein